MSIRNGEKARANITRKRAIARRVKETAARAAAKQGTPARTTKPRSEPKEQQ